MTISKPKSPQRQAIRKLLSRKMVWVSGGYLLALLLATTFTVVTTPHAHMFDVSTDILLPPSAAFWFGTDDLGRDVFTQVIYGARVSLTVGILSAVFSSFIGIVIGSLSGYVGGTLDAVIMRVTEVFQVMPIFVLATLIVALAGPGELRVIVVITILSWPQVARLMRGEVIRVKNLGFVEAVRCLGISERHILLFEVIPNALAPVIATSTLMAALAILLESALGFLGLSSADSISWGITLNSGQRLLYQAWWLSFFPGLAIFLTALAFNMLGDCIRISFNPKDRK